MQRVRSASLSPSCALCSRWPSSLTCIGRLFAMVKLGIGGKALYVLVRAVSVRPNMEPDVKEETAEEEKRGREKGKVITEQGRAKGRRG